MFLDTHLPEEGQVALEDDAVLQVVGAHAGSLGGAGVPRHREHPLRLAGGAGNSKDDPHHKGEDGELSDMEFVTNFTRSHFVANFCYPKI